MFQFLSLIVRSLGRNKMRTSLTALAVVVLVSIYTLASTVTDTVNQMLRAYSSQTRLIVREKWVMPSVFPVRYISRIADVPGVEDWTVWHFYAGTLDNAGHNGAGIATRMDNLCRMHSGLETLDPRLIAAMQRQKDGALVGRWILQQMNWKVGQRFTMNSFTHLGKNLQFTIVGKLPSELWARNFFFREDYYQEATQDKETVNIVWLRVADDTTGKRVSADVERLFEKSPAKLRVETESAGAGRFIGRIGTVVNIINFVVSILLIDMVIVLSNSISMTVRERRRELAIFKILGFRPWFLLAMVVGEAMLVGAASGLLGAGSTYLLSLLNSLGRLPVRIDFLLQFPIPLKFVLHGLAIGALVAFFGSIIPAFHARRVRVVEAFSNVS